GAPDSLLDTYEQERRQVAADVLQLSSRLHRKGVDRVETDRRNPAISQLELNYRGGGLARELRPEPGGVQAGDRAPDGFCIDACGNLVRLFDLFRGPHFTLLAFGANAAEAAVRLKQTLKNVKVVTITAGCEVFGDTSLQEKDGSVSRAYEARS